MSRGLPILCDMTPAELGEHLAPHGFSAVEARRIFAHHVQHGRRHWDVKNMARQKLTRAAALLDTPTLEVVDRRRDAADGFVKYLFALADGARVEAVRIPIFDDKYTLCLSSQAGCPLDCVFCATGRLGYTRNLATWEIVEQLRIVRDEADRPVRGVVFMGMGEPFLNYDAVLRAARIFADPSGGAISGRAITISTSGVVPAIRRFTAERHPYRLAISLTGATRARRRSLMPAAEKTWPHRRARRRRARARGRDARSRDARVRGHRRRQLRRRRRRGAGRAAARHPGAPQPHRRQRRHRPLPPAERRGAARLHRRAAAARRADRAPLLGRKGRQRRMRDARRDGVALLAFVAACSSATKPLPPPDLSTVSETFAPARATVGDAVGIANQLAFDDAARAGQLDRLDGLAVHLVRRDFLWADLEPSAGSYDFAAEDAAVDDSRARGLTTIGILAYDTSWASPDGDVDTPPDPKTFAAFVEATARHFAGRVDLWEIWNEPNVGYRFWKPREDGAEYARLLAAAYPAVKRGNPKATVLLGGLFYHYEGIVTDAITFLSDAFTYNPELGRWFDVLALHPYAHYPPEASPEQDDGREQPIGQMIARMRAELAYYGAAKPVWVTEVGWPVYGTVDEATQARFTVRAAVEAMAAGAERVCFYTLDDGPNPTAFPPEDAFGVYRNDGTPKPAATALHTLVSIDPALVVTADGSTAGLRRYTLASAATHVDVVFAVDGATHDLGAPAGAMVLGLDGNATSATSVGANPLFVVSR